MSSSIARDLYRGSISAVRTPAYRRGAPARAGSMRAARALTRPWKGKFFDRSPDTRVGPARARAADVRLGGARRSRTRPREPERVPARADAQERPGHLGAAGARLRGADRRDQQG